VTLLWNAAGSALLALTASDTDATNQSYYGEQKLHFLAADGSLDCLVPVPKARPGPAPGRPRSARACMPAPGVAADSCVPADLRAHVAAFKRGGGSTRRTRCQAATGPPPAPRPPCRA